MTKLRTVIIGCGAISQEWHIPVLAGHPAFTITALVDKDKKTLDTLSSGYNVSNFFSDYKLIEINDIDAVVIATPVAFHFEIARYFLSNNKHVLVEKPIALDATQAAELVSVAHEHNVTLSVGLYRRLYPSVHVMKELIDTREFGSVNNFEFNWGDFYNWGATSLGNMQKELAGGGVLIDLGPHAMDWLTTLFGNQVSLVAYEDDSLGGIDADCRLSLKFKQSDHTVTGSLNLSRTRKLGGSLVVNFDNASAELGVGERYSVSINKFAKGNTPISYKAAFKDQKDMQWFESFKAQFDDFANAIKDATEPYLSGKSVLPAMNIISECYSEGGHSILPWVENDANFSADDFPYKRVLITGASGFIGGRLAEVLSIHTDSEIIAGVNNPNNASRLSRLDVRIVQVDLTDSNSIETAIAGCDAVIHCAVGTAYGQDKLIKEVTVGGTENLVTLAKQHKIKRFVHLSSLSVMQMDSGDEINEKTPVISGDNNIYASSKLEAEKIVKKVASEGLPCIVLRPTNVYGPNSPFFKVGAGIQLLRRGISMSKRTAETPVNAVYIDNLIEVILLSLKAPENTADGRHYMVNDNDGTTHQMFYQNFAEKFGKELTISDSLIEGSQKQSNTSAGVLTEMKDVVASAELKQWLKKVYNSPKLGWGARKLFEQFPALEDKFRDSTPIVYQSEDDNSSTPLYIEPPTFLTVTTARLESELGYMPVVHTEEAFGLTQDWLKYSYGPELEHL